MKRLSAFVAALAVAATTASPALAISDHLQCMKIKDTTAKASYTATLTPTDTTFAAAAGCTITVPAKLLCVDTTKSAVTPAPPGAASGAAAQKYLCYKARCPKDQPTDTLTDQFGVHSITVKKTSLLCAPVPAPPSCTDGLQNGAETDVDCGGGTCPTCADGLGCSIAGDCTSGNCMGGTCTAAAPTCTDLTQNGNETGVDCGGGSCPQCGDGEGCLSAMDCVSGVCSGGICISGLGNGTACSSNGQCTSGNCVDGVCCNSSCGGVCQACTAVKKGGGMDGACGAISSNTDPDSECAASAQTTCGTTGSCNGSGACELWPASTVCATGFCSGNSATAASQCDGAGTCVPGMSTPCSPYACSGSSCLSSCSFDGDCASGFYCSGSLCVAQLTNGSPCSTNGSCSSGSCVDGVCCNSACTGLCQACVATKTGSSDGTCANISASTDPDNECAGSGTCDGSGACQP